MTNKVRLTFGLLLMAFLLIPGLVHYIKSHEQMRIELAHKDRDIAELRSDKKYNNSDVSTVVASNAPENLTAISIYKFCLPRKV